MNKKRTLGGVPVANTSKKLSASSLFQCQAKGERGKGGGRAKPKLWLHKYWQRNKKPNPCCLEGGGEKALWQLAVNHVFGGLASEG